MRAAKIGPKTPFCAFELPSGVATIKHRMRSAQQPSNLDILLRRGFTPHRTSLEDRVAYQWETAGNVLGALHRYRRNKLIVEWLLEAAKGAGRPASVLDIGCAYGKHLFMLDAFLDEPTNVTLVGVDISEDAIAYANAFAATIPGFANCTFERADLTSGLPFEDNTFDAVNFADVIEHVAAPEDALREIRRVAKPGAAVVISTPLRDSLFKRIARIANRFSRGGIYGAYYAGKGTALDEAGEPIMEAPAGLGHVSEMSWYELRRAVNHAGFDVRRTEFMSVMSGSEWFDEHKPVLAGLLLIEAIHDVLRRPSWAHSVMLELVAADNSRGVAD